MGRNRLEAFTDGVIAVIITVMVLEMKPPHGAGWSDLIPVAPVFLSYVLSFIYVGIYWGNHHHLFHLVKHVDGRVMWANLHLLFWLSLVPFTTAWMGENHFDTWPTVLYGVNLMLAAGAYDVMVRAIHRVNADVKLAGHAAQGNSKRAWSVVLYVAAIPLAFVHVLAADALYLLVAILWIIPDRGIEQAVGAEL